MKVIILKRNYKIFSIVLFAIFSVNSSTVHATPSESASGAITHFISGWHDNSVTVQLNIPHYNPKNCPLSDGYATDPASGGTTLFNSVLLTAVMGQKQVRLVVDGCFSGRPRIVGVRIDV
jgi:hypothetical protein